MKISLKSQLYDMAKRHYPKWINGGEFERYAMSNGYKPSHADRRARDLVKEGSLQRRKVEGGVSVEYIYRSPEDKNQLILI